MENNVPIQISTDSNNLSQIETNSNNNNADNSIETVSKSLLKGVIRDDLPKKQPSEIRIFLSSTFKDFKLERNYIIEHIYETLRRFCNEQYQKDFILIDLRWGITDEATNQNLGLEMCLNEIDKCRDESVGPYFVCFLSHRYGTKFLKSSILENEFEHIRKESSAFPYKHITSILDYCYQLDENNINERRYKLKSTNDILQGLNVDINEWEEQSNILIDRLRKAAESLDVDENEKDKYLQSVTEQEIRYGLLNESNPNRKCAAFFRNITGLNVNIAKSFIEDKDGELQLNTLKDLVDKKLSQQNKYYFQIEWNKTNEFKEPYTQEIIDYLKMFGDAFESIITGLIRDNVNDFTNDNTNLDHEILHHALLCNKLVKQTIIRDDIIVKVQSYLNDDTNTKPFIVTGASGSGKSTILAYIIKHLKKDDNIFVYRFMGTSRESSNIKSIMLSILKQLKNIFEDDDKKAETKEDSHNEDKEKDLEISKIKDDFIKILKFISQKNENSKLVIVLDSIDQLAKSDYSLEWFIHDLPKNIKMIYSVIPDYFDILNRLKEKIDYNKSNYLKLDELENNNAKGLLDNWLSSVDRKLTGSLADNSTSTQWSFLNKLLTKTSQIYPLHIRIIFEIVSKWPSWYKVETEFMSCISTKDTIKYLFKRLETFHGKILFSRCAFYVTLFEYSGISEAELEDILSIDDEVLNSVFVHHHPPVRRFQIALWLKIKYEIKDYITNKETDGVSVISWFHRSFIEASKEYYKNMFESCDLKDKLLMNVIDYFTETYNETRSNRTKGVKKEFEYVNKKLQNFEKINNQNNHMYAAYRYTKNQKIKSIITTVNQIVTVYNKRKLNELVNVISMMQNNDHKVDLLKKHVYFNYEFIHAKCELKELNFIFETGINQLLSLSSNDTKVDELREISEIYKHIYPKIRQYPNLVNFEVLSRLSDNKSHYVEEFQSPSGLKMISTSFIEKETIKDLYVSDFQINSFYEQHNTNLLFIESTNLDENKTVLEIIDSFTTKSIGSVTFDKHAFHIQIITTAENTNVANKLTDFNGFVYYSNGNSLFNFSFANESFCLINTFETEIKGLLLLNSAHLLVTLEDTLFLLSLENINGNLKMVIKETIKEDNKIQFIESTLLKETVFDSKYLDKNDSITLVIGLEHSNLIQIYKFNNFDSSLSLVCVIDSIKWSFYEPIEDGGHLIKRESILIDESFLIGNVLSTNLNRSIVKFALQFDGLTKIIEVDDKGEFSLVDEIHESIFEMDDKKRYVYKYGNGKSQIAGVELEAFKNDKILFKLRSSYYVWYIYLYNIEKKSLVSKINIKGIRVNTDIQNGLILSQQGGIIVFYKINNDETINELSSVQTSSYNYNVRKSEIKIKNRKLLRIDPEKRLSIKEIDFLIKSQVSNKNDLIKVYGGFIYEISGRHILVKEDEKNNFHISIVDIVDQKIIKSLVLEDDKRDVDIIGCTNDYLVLFNYKKSDLIVYKIEKKQDSFAFKKMYKEHVQGVYYSLFNQCYFNDIKPTRFTVTLNKRTNDKIEVRVMDDKDNKLNVLLSIVSLNNIELEHSKLTCLVTSLNEYFIIYQQKSKLIYLVDITGNRIIDKIEMSDCIQSIQPIFDSDDLLVGCSNAFYYIKYDIQSNKLNKIILKDYQQELRGIEIQHQYLLVQLDSDLIEIYKLNDDFKNKYELNGPIKLSKQVYKVHKSANSKYLIIETKDKELCIFKFDNLNQIASLYLNSNLYCNLVSNEEYISFRLQQNSCLMTFKIVESQ